MERLAPASPPAPPSSSRPGARPPHPWDAHPHVPAADPRVGPGEQPPGPDEFEHVLLEVSLSGQRRLAGPRKGHPPQAIGPARGPEHAQLCHVSGGVPERRGGPAAAVRTLFSHRLLAAVVPTERPLPGVQTGPAQVFRRGRVSKADWCPFSIFLSVNFGSISGRLFLFSQK